MLVINPKEQPAQATNKDNFKELDQLIAKCISLDEFFEQLKQSTEQEKSPVKK